MPGFNVLDVESAVKVVGDDSDELMISGPKIPILGSMVEVGGGPQHIM